MAVIWSEQYMSFLVPCVPICPMCPYLQIIFKTCDFVAGVSNVSHKTSLCLQKCKNVVKSTAHSSVFCFSRIDFHIIRKGDHDLEILNIKSDHII